MTPETQELIETLKIKLSACQQLIDEVVKLNPPLPVVVRADLAFELIQTSRKFLDIYKSNN